MVSAPAVVVTHAFTQHSRGVLFATENDSTLFGVVVARIELVHQSAFLRPILHRMIHLVTEPERG
jgi:hypothetical protein